MTAVISKKQIEKFISKHKNLTDKAVHNFAAKHKMTPDKLEEQIYKFARKGIRKR